MTFVLAFVTAVVFIFCLIDARKLPRFFASLMLLSGIVIFNVKESELQTILNSLTLNLPLLTLMILVPLISIPFRIGGYFESILFFLKRLVEAPKKMFLSISTFLFFFGPILNLGSIRVANEMLKDLRLPPILLAKSYLVGFSTVILWSPYFASVALVLYYLKIHVSDYIFLGLTLAVIQLVIGNVLYSIYYNRFERPQRLNFKQTAAVIDEPIREEEKKKHVKTLTVLVAILIVLMISLFSLEHVTKWPMMLLVSLMSIVFPIVFCTVTRNWQSGKEHIKAFFHRVGTSVNNEVVMFTSAGVFANSLSGTQFADTLNLFLTDLALRSFLLFCMTVVFIVVLLTFFGLHTSVVVTVLITQLDPVAIGTSPQVLALIFMISW